MKSSIEKFSSFFHRFSLGTLLSRFSGFGREVVMAAMFGATPIIANFWMAFRFAHLLRRFFAEGAMHVSFLPHFMQLKEKNPQESAYFFYELTLWISFFLLTIILVADGIMGAFLLFGEVSQESREVMTFTLLFSPSLIFISLYALNSSFLHSENRFFLSSAAPTVVNVVWIAAALILPFCGVATVLEKVAIIIVLGFALQYLVTLPSVIRFISEQKLKSDKALAKCIRQEMRVMLRPFFYAILGVMGTQLNSALDMLFAKAVSAEGPAYLWYAIRLQQLPLGLFGVGLATVLLPALSKNMELAARESIIRFTLHKAIVLMVPITAAFLIMGSSMVEIVFAHGKFTEFAVQETARALSMYAFALLPMTLVMILASWFYAKKETALPALCALAGVVCNIGLNAFFVFVLQWGIESIALATTISGCVNVLLLLFFMFREGVRIEASSFAVIGKTVVATLVASWAAYQVGGHFLIQAALFSALFLLISYLIKLREFTELVPINKLR